MCLLLAPLYSFLRLLASLLNMRRDLIDDHCLRICIKTGSGESFTLSLQPEWSIGRVKEVVGPRLGLTPDQLKIIFAGKELADTVIISDCDLGQQSVLHAVKLKQCTPAPSESSSTSGGPPLCETLAELSTTDTPSEGGGLAHFYVYCGECRGLRSGKLRVKCSHCSGGAFTVHADPQSWWDVLEPRRITGTCENDRCTEELDNREPTFAVFYFRCSGHLTLSDTDSAVPLRHIRPNHSGDPCLACGDVLEESGDPVLSWDCGHVACMSCFLSYCSTMLRDRRFQQHPSKGYTLPCPERCEGSEIEEVHHFRLLSEELYQQYQRFSAEDYVLQAGGVFCPRPGCGAGIVPDDTCSTRIACRSCEYVFCRRCLQGYHLDDCEETGAAGEGVGEDRIQLEMRRREDATKIVIKVTTKPCPKCRTPTERDGGCMHMICTRAGCGYHWCWVCQGPWMRDCMASHWFG